MVLDKKRTAVDPILTFFAQRFIRINPDVFTWTSLIFALIAGLFFYLSTEPNEIIIHYLLYGSLFVFLNGLFDAIDGKIARITQTASPRGDFLDHALDRYADVCIIGGIALSAWCDTRIGVFAITGMLLTSYMGTQAQAVGLKRMYAGLLGRADRIAILIIVPIIQYIMIYYHYPYLWNLSLIEWAMIYLAVVGNITAIQRFTSTLIYFKKEKIKKRRGKK